MLLHIQYPDYWSNYSMQTHYLFICYRVNNTLYLFIYVFFFFFFNFFYIYTQYLTVKDRHQTVTSSFKHGTYKSLGLGDTSQHGGHLAVRPLVLYKSVQAEDGVVT